MSGTWRENIQAVLEAAGLVECFDASSARRMSRRSKPAPEAYELALKKLRISAKSAVAIEDSPSGVASARAAGIRVIAVGHRHPFGDWVGDSLYVSGFEPVAGTARASEAVNLTTARSIRLHARVKSHFPRRFASSAHQSRHKPPAILTKQPVPPASRVEFSVSHPARPGDVEVNPGR